MRIFDEEALAMVIALAKNGMNNIEIAAETGWGRSTIQRHLSKCNARADNTNTRKLKYSPERVQIIKKARDMGLTIEGAAAKAGISATTFYTWRAQGLIKDPSLQKADTGQDKYRRIYARYMTGTETPGELAAIYKMHVATLLKAWRKLGLPLDQTRTVQQRALSIRVHKKRPAPEKLVEQWNLYSNNKINANEASAALGMSWLRLRRLWQEMNFPIDIVAKRHMRNSWRLASKASACARSKRLAQNGKEVWANEQGTVFK